MDSLPPARRDRPVDSVVSRRRTAAAVGRIVKIADAVSVLPSTAVNGRILENAYEAPAGDS